MPSESESPWEAITEKVRAATAGELIIFGELGRGGMAAVLLAYDTNLARCVAVKVMAPELLMDEGLVERFMAEAATMANFRHPNIVAVHAVRRIESIRFFVMEFIAGQSLDRIIGHAGPLGLPMTRAIVSQVGSALAYAHRRGVTHRDIKPGNILVDAEGTAFVTDFGIAKTVQSSLRTHTGVLLGTPAYMSPEQCLGLPVTSASDQYSLGVVVFEMLTGRLPFQGSSFVAMQGHALDPVPPPRELRPDLPEDVERALVRMLAKAPEERWPSMREALAALGAHPLDENDPLRGELAALATVRDARSEAYESFTPRLPRAASVVQEQTDRANTYLVLSDPPVAIAPGDAFRMSAFVCRGNGTIVDGSVAWSSSNPRIARVDHATGVVRALAAGEVRLTAAATGLVAGAEMQVRSTALRPDARRRRYFVPIVVTMMAGGVSLAALALIASHGLGRTDPTPPAGIEASQIPDSLMRPKVVAATGAESRARRVTASVHVYSSGRQLSRRPTRHEVVRQSETAAPTSAPDLTQKVSGLPITSSPSLSTSERPESIIVRGPNPSSQQLLSAEASRCTSFLESKSGEQLAQVVTSEAAAAAEMRALLAIVRDDGAQLRVSQPLYDKPRLGDTSASQEFEVRLMWRSSFGRVRNATVRFRSTMENTPTGWKPAACQLVRSSGLR